MIGHVDTVQNQDRTEDCGSNGYHANVGFMPGVTIRYLANTTVLYKHWVQLKQTKRLGSTSK